MSASAMKILAKAAATNVLQEIEIIKVNEVLDSTTDDEWCKAANIVIDSICSYIRNGAESMCGKITTGYGSESSLDPDKELNKRGMKLFEHLLESAPDKFKFYQMISTYQDENNEKNKNKGGRVEPEPEIITGGTNIPGNLGVSTDASTVAAAANNLSQLSDIPGNMGVSTDAIAAAANVSNPISINSGDETLELLTGITGDREISQISSDKIATAWSTQVAKHIRCSKELHEKVIYLINIIFTSTEKILIDDVRDIFEDTMKIQLAYSKQKINQERMKFHSQHLKYFTNLLDQIYKPSLNQPEKIENPLLKPILNGYVKMLADYYKYLLIHEKNESGGSANNTIRTYLDKIAKEDKEILNNEIHKLSNNYIDFKNEFGVDAMDFVTGVNDKPLGFYEQIYNLAVPSKYNKKKNNSIGGKKKRKFTKKRNIKTKRNTTK